MSKALRKDGSKLQQPDWLARSQSNRTIFHPPNDSECIYKQTPTKSRLTMWNGSEFILTIQPHSNRGIASKLIFNCIYYVVAQRNQSIDW